ncbi:P-loop NTPase [Chloroflexota bacterium]
MVTEDNIREKFDEVLVPGVMRSVTGLNMVREIAVSDGSVKITLSSAALTTEEEKSVLKDKTISAVKTLAGVKTVDVEYAEVPPADMNRIDHVIAVMSGKGGVGKSLVSGLTAVALRRQGYEVGILDADITGPSIPRMFGIVNKPIGGENGIMPVLSRTGIEIMSVNLLLPNEEDAIIWRGPLISQTIKQFGSGVVWGKLDYLIIDLPPGTADAPITVMQSFPVSGIIIVYTPQDLVDMIVRKAVNMAKKVKKPILGVVENMSYLYVPEIKKKMEVFGKSRGQEMAQAAGAPLLAQIPIDPTLARLCDAGEFETYTDDLVEKLGKAVVESIKFTAVKIT